MKATFYRIFAISINAIALVVGNSNGVPCCEYHPHPPHPIRWNTGSAAGV
jgi:hypothetical protein